MPIVVTLDVMLARRKMRSRELAERVGITEANLSLLKSGKVRGVRFDTLARICEVLQCQPGDLLAWEPGPESEVGGDAECRHAAQATPCAVVGDCRPAPAAADPADVAAASSVPSRAQCHSAATAVAAAQAASDTHCTANGALEAAA
jgi:putative transcriptional regulator